MKDWATMFYWMEISRIHLQGLCIGCPITLDFAFVQTDVLIVSSIKCSRLQVPTGPEKNKNKHLHLLSPILLQ